MLVKILITTTNGWWTPKNLLFTKHEDFPYFVKNHKQFSKWFNLLRILFSLVEMDLFFRSFYRLLWDKKTSEFLSDTQVKFHNLPRFDLTLLRQYESCHPKSISNEKFFIFIFCWNQKYRSLFRKKGSISLKLSLFRCRTL